MKTVKPSVERKQVHLRSVTRIQRLGSAFNLNLHFQLVFSRISISIAPTRVQTDISHRAPSHYSYVTALVGSRHHYFSTVEVYNRWCGLGVKPELVKCVCNFYPPLPLRFRFAQNAYFSELLNSREL
jgi:hypothetical protein